MRCRSLGSRFTRGEPGALAAVLWHGEDIADGRVAVDGDLDAVRRLLRLFPAP